MTTPLLLRQPILQTVVIFVQANALQLPFKNKTYDAVISFETIEHVRNTQGFISEMCRILKHGGLFICSTPNVRYSSHLEYHLIEFTPEDFLGQFENTFSNLNFYAQYFRPTDYLIDMLKRYFTFGLTKISKLKLISSLKSHLLTHPSFFFGKLTLSNLGQPYSIPTT